MADFVDMLNRIFVLPVAALLSQISELLPQIVLAGLLIIAMYFISDFAGAFVRKILYKIRIDRIVRVKDRRDSFGATSLAAVYSYLAKWSIFFLFAVKVIEIADLGLVLGIADMLMQWLSKIILAVLIAVTGIVLIDFFTLRMLNARESFAINIAKAARAFFIIVLIFTSLEQLGFRLVVAENVFLMFVGAALFAVALALGIGFGLALKEEAGIALRRLRKRK